MIYRHLGYQKVNRDERHRSWTRAYLEHKNAELFWGSILIVLFVVLFAVLIGAAWTR